MLSNSLYVATDLKVGVLIWLFFYPPSVEYNMINEGMFDNYADDIYKLDSEDTDRQCELFSDKVSCWWQLHSNVLQGIPAQYHKNQTILEAI